MTIKTNYLYEKDSFYANNVGYSISKFCPTKASKKCNFDDS